MTDARGLVCRVDGGPQVGMGHVMRSLALAQAWQDRGGAVSFLTGEGTMAVEGRLQGEGMSVHCFHVVPGSEEDALETAAFAREMGADWVVLDGYCFGTEYQKCLKESGSRILAIDDCAECSYYSADIVLNQNIYAHEGLYRDRALNSELLLGPGYALLRREFHAKRCRRRNESVSGRNVLVTFGGADANNITLRALEALEQLAWHDLRAQVVVGPFNTHGKCLQERAAGAGGRFQLVASGADMPGLMAWADVGIAASGSTCWELLFMGVPSIVLILAENQRGIGEGLDSAGAVVNLGWHETVTAGAIAGALGRLLAHHEIRRRFSAKGRELVDGDGGSRVVSTMLRRLAS